MPSFYWRKIIMNLNIQKVPIPLRIGEHHTSVCGGIVVGLSLGTNNYEQMVDLIVIADIGNINHPSSKFLVTSEWMVISSIPKKYVGNVTYNGLMYHVLEME